MKIDVPPINDFENGPSEFNFEEDLALLKGTYSDNILDLVHDNKELLFKNYVAWQKSLTNIAKKLGTNPKEFNEIPNLLQEVTFNKIKDKFSHEKPKKIVLGIAGPGAVGKETIKDSLGFDGVINTTTRAKRDYENQDEQYHFVNDEEFSKIISEDGFIVNTEKKGRGKYGIKKDDIDKVLFRSNIATIEENPVNLTGVNDYIKKNKDCEFILIYIIPPSPVLLHLAARLAKRCEKSGEDFKLAIDPTLGSRQLEEFNSILIPMEKDINVAFLVNDKVNIAVGKIKELISSQ